MFVLFAFLASVLGQQTCTVVGRVWYDNCNKRCVCEFEGNRLVANCYRERKEFSCLTTQERTRLINTYRAVTTPGRPRYNQYVALIDRHPNFFGPIHVVSSFLPWHRWFSHQMEDLLQAENCNVTLPWWDAARNPVSPWGQLPWGSATTLYGTNGQGFDRCVRDGGFAFPGYPGGPRGGCLQRNIALTTGVPSYFDEARALNYFPTQYSAFSNALQSDIHDVVHVRIGGTMATGYSPQAPEFFLHHNHIDKLWDDWQKRSPQHLNAYPWSRTTPMTVANGATVGQFNDLRATRVIYVRDSPNSPNPTCTRVAFASGRSVRLDNLTAALESASPAELRRVAQTPVAALTEAEEAMLVNMEREFGTNESMIELQARLSDARTRRARLEQTLAGAGSIRPSFVGPTNQELGFDLSGAVRVLGIETSPSTVMPVNAAKGPNPKAKNAPNPKAKNAPKAPSGVGR